MSFATPLASQFSRALTEPFRVAPSVPGQSFASQVLAKSNAPDLSGHIRGEQPAARTSRTKQPGRYYNFDGTNDYIALDSNLSFADAMTVCWWAKRDATADIDIVFGYSAAGKLGYGSGDTIFARWAAGLTTDTGDAGVDTTEWHHIAMVRNADDTGLIYVNGIARDFDSGQAITGTAIYDRIGTDESVSSSTFDGLLADIRAYDSALTESQIRELVTEGTDALANVDTELHYKCDDTHPTIAYDSSGNGNHGTKTSITANDFHASGSDAPFSFQNDKGYTPYLHFDGTDDDIPLPTAGVVEDAAGAVSVWFTRDESVVALRNIWDMGGSGLNGLALWSDRTSGGSAYFTYGTGATSATIVLEDWVENHTLHHALVRWSGTDIEVFIDGVSRGSGSDFDPNLAAYASKHIGSNGGAVRHHKGCIKDFWTFSNQLSDDDVAAIYAAGPGGSPSLAGSELFRMPLDDSDQKYWDTVSSTDHTPSDAPTLIRAGRDESDKTKDWYGGTLQYSGKCPSNAQMTGGNCAHMDGTNDYVEVADHADFNVLSNNVSWFWRAKNNSASISAAEMMLAKWDGTSDREVGFYLDTSEKLVAQFGDSLGTSTEGTWISDAAIPDIDSDRSYGITFDDGVVTFYVDGLVIASSLNAGSIPSTINLHDAAITLGAQLSGGSPVNNWDGTLYDARIFSGDSAVLTAAQMLQLHNCEAESFTGQTNVLWLPMAEGAGSIHYDVSGNGHDGDISGHTANDYFGSTQDVFHYNASKGFSKRQNKWGNASNAGGFPKTG